MNTSFLVNLRFASFALMIIQIIGGYTILAKVDGYLASLVFVAAVVQYFTQRAADKEEARLKEELFIQQMGEALSEQRNKSGVV